MEFVKLSPKHDDVITDIAFDYYGKRFATCSTDRHIKIWDLIENEDKNGKSNEQSTWSCYDISSAHLESIWRVTWSHPEFGNLIASCSEDRTVIIWEEQESVSNHKELRDKWVRKATLCESKRAINDVKFAPKHLGLKIATASADGLLRIYEATDIFSLAFWQLQEAFRVEDTLQDNSENIISSNVSEHGLTCLSWCDCPFETPRIAIGGYSKRAVVWALQNGKWIEESVLGKHGDTVHDIAWAPSMGRSYHLIATASRETTFQVHLLLRKEQGVLEYSRSVEIPVVNDSPVWRVTWNATGTVLATSSEDGTLALFRRNFSGDWINIQVLPSDADQFRSFYQN